MRQELWALIARLRSEGTSILMSTHDIDEAERLADSVTLLAFGLVMWRVAITRMQRRLID